MLNSKKFVFEKEIFCGTISRHAPRPYSRSDMRDGVFL